MAKELSSLLAVSHSVCSRPQSQSSGGGIALWRSTVFCRLLGRECWSVGRSVGLFKIRKHWIAFQYSLPALQSHRSRPFHSLCMVVFVVRMVIVVAVAVVVAVSDMNDRWLLRIYSYCIAIPPSHPPPSNSPVSVACSKRAA